MEEELYWQARQEFVREQMQDERESRKTPSQRDSGGADGERDGNTPRVLRLQPAEQLERVLREFSFRAKDFVWPFLGVYAGDAAAGAATPLPPAPPPPAPPPKGSA